MSLNCAPMKHPPLVTVSIVPGEIVAQDWQKHYRQFVVDALEYENDPIEILEVLQHLRQCLWIALAITVNGQLMGFCICEQKHCRKGFELNIRMLAGDWMEAWIDALFDQLKIIARIHKCDALRVQGRMGWLKVLKGYGFAPISQTLKLGLDDG